MLHRVIPDEPTAFGLPGCYRIRGTALTPQELVALLESLESIIPIERIEKALVRNVRPPHGAALSFDDGYREHSREVADMLAAFEATAVFYVSSALHAGSGTVAVVDAWYWLLDHTTKAEVQLTLPDGCVLQGCLHTLEGKREWVLGQPKAALLALSWGQQCELVRALSEALDCPLPNDLAASLYMHRHDWADLERRGHRLGAHGVHHQHLTSLASEALWQELTRSMQAVPTDAPFAYPDGVFDPQVVTAVKRAGASSAVTCESGSVVPTSELFRLPRRFVRPEDVA